MAELPDRSNVESHHPRTVVERAADAALTAARESLEREGADALEIFVTIHAAGIPADELDCASAGHGYENARELLVELVGAAAAVGKQLGIQVDVLPMTGPIGRG